jgi:hypothetical protein
MMSGAALAQQPAGRQTEPQKQLIVWGAYGDSDNIGRASTLESGSYHSLGLFLGLGRQTARLDTAISADIEYRGYSDDTLESEAVGMLDARALVDVVQDRFAWNFEGSLDQAQQDPFAARGPNNRETVTNLATGPRLDIPFGRTSLMVSASRTAQRYEESEQFDNDSDYYELGLSRQVRPTTALALVGTSSEAEYVDGVAPTYRIDQLFVRIDSTLRRSTLSVDVGTNEISFEAQSRRDPLLNLSWSRLVGARSTLGITAAQGFTDTGDIGIGGSAIVTATPFEQETIGVDYSLAGSRVTIGVGITTGQEDYAGGTMIDNDYRSTDLTIGYSVSARLRIGFRYEFYDREFQDSLAPSTTQEDTTAGLWLDRSLGQRFSIAFDISRYEATGSQRIEESRWEFRFMYSPTGRTSSAMGSIGR